MRSISLIAIAASSYPLILASQHSNSNKQLQIRQLDTLPANSTDPSDTPAEWDEFIYYDASNDSDEGWWDVSTGMMVFSGEESDYGVDKSSVVEYGHSLKRDGIVSRDTKRGVGTIGFDGNFPRNWNQLKSMARHVKRKTWSVVITWYNGNDLKNPSCGNKSNWTPKDSSLIFARTIVWSGGPACGQFVLICAKNNKKKCVYVREWDTCGGCKSGVPHMDLTQGAFKKLYSLDVGLVNGIVAKPVSVPFSKWGSAQTAAYGPKVQ